MVYRLCVCCQGPLVCENAIEAEPGCVLLNRLLRKSSHKVVFASPLFSVPRVDQEAGQSARRCFCTRDQPLPSEVHRELHVHLCSFPSPVLEHLASLKQSLFCPFLVVCRKPKQNAEAENRGVPTKELCCSWQHRRPCGM